MKFPTTIFAALACVTGACAQQISVSLAAPNPLVMSSTVMTPASGTVTNAWQLPGGTLPGFGYYPASGTAIGRPGWLAWSTQAASTVARLYIHQSIHLAPNGVAASVGANEFVFTVAATTPVAATVNLGWFGQASTGVQVPVVSVDIGDDGVVDFTQSSGQNEYDVAIGASPLRIRVVLDNQVAVPGSTSSSLVVDVLPRNDVAIQKAVLGCTGEPFDLLCEPTFIGSGVEFGRAAGFQLPAVLVLGLAAQPVMLPVSTPTAPCLLLPSQDALVALLGNTHTVLLPAGVRPITFWGQGVAIDAQGELSVTDGYRIAAQ